MAGTSLLALIDDITSVLDDVAVLTKVATKKTAGVLGDDLALNAHQLSGARADRELPVVWAVAKGSMVNKAILVPGALAISALAPWAVTPLLMVGGAFLCFEGCEKLAHKLWHPAEAEAEQAALREALTTPEVDLVALERDKIKGAVRTDFVLSAEIVAIALGTVASQAFAMRAAVLVGIAVVMTIGVYGLVAGIVKLDDLGQHLAERGARAGSSAGGRLQRRSGAIILAGAPYLMRALSIAGTAAMFLVGGGILSHGIPAASAWLHGLALRAAVVPGVGGLLSWLVPLLGDAAIGIAAGALVLAVVSGIKRAIGAKKSTA